MFKRVANLFSSVITGLMVAGLGFAYLSSPQFIAPAQSQSNFVAAQNYCFVPGPPSNWLPCSITNPLVISGSFSATLSGFAPATTGTPITATTGGATGTLPAGAVVVVFNTGATNAAYCKLGASSTVNDIAIQPGSWFAYTVGAATQLTCITSSSTTTVSMVGGTGLPTGAGGGGGGGGGGSNASVGTTGASVPGSATYLGIISGGNLVGWNGAVTNAGTFAVQASQAGTWNVTNAGTFATQATQAGTWTVQPGNTANTTAWLVTGTGGTFPATQSGTWNITNISGTVSLPTGAATAANQASLIGPVGAGTAAANSWLTGAVFNSTPITVANGQQAALQSDANGYLKVNVAAGGASGGTSSNFAATFPSTGTAAGMSQGGNMVALTGTSGNLNVQCANCSGSGVSTVDAATFTASTSLFAGSGGFFQTTATSNPLTNGQQGMVQLTANRAYMTNLRTSAGVETGVAAAPLQVSLANTSANAAAVLTTGTGGTFPATQSGTWTVQPGNTANTTAWLVTGTGGTFPATQSGTWNITNISGTVSLPTGASTAANQTSVIGTKAAGTAATNSLLTGGVYNSSGITLTDGQQAAAQFDSTGNLKVSGTGLAQGSTTSGQSGSLIMGAVTTASPTYTTAQTSPLSLDTAGSLRVAIISGAGSGGTASNFGSSFPTAGTAAGFTDGTNMVAGRVGAIANAAAATNQVNVAPGCRYDSTLPTLTDTRFNQCQVDVGGRMYVTGVGGTFPVTATNLSTNISQINGVTPLMGAGNTGTGSLRTTQSTDQAALPAWGHGATGAAVPAGATYMAINSGGNLTGWNGAVTNAGTFAVQIAANSSVNVAQINGVTTLMGNGATGTGSQRVTLANDSTAIAGWGLGAIGSAAPTGGQQTGVRSGANMVAMTQANASAAISVSTATTTQLVALSASAVIHVTSWDVISAGTGNVTMVYGTGSACGTGTTSLTGAYPLTAQAGIAKGSGIGPVLVVPAGNALCITTSAAVQVSGSVSYTQYVP